MIVGVFLWTRATRLNQCHSSLQITILTDCVAAMPAMDLALIQSLGRDLHHHSPGYIGEDEVCPWTLFLTMALTLLKGQSASQVHHCTY